MIAQTIVTVQKHASAWLFRFMGVGQEVMLLAHLLLIKIDSNKKFSELDMFVFYSNTLDTDYML